MTELNTNCVKVYGELLSFTPDNKVITVKNTTDNKQSNKENEEYTEVYGELLTFDNDMVKITNFRTIEANINNMYECMICKKLYRKQKSNDCRLISLFGFSKIYIRHDNYKSERIYLEECPRGNSLSSHYFP
jgi:hypothetical protein